MSVSARNQLHGKVSAIHPGSINDEIEIALDKGGRLVSVVTSSSRLRLGLEKGKEVIALVKAPWIILASEDNGMLFSARNQYPGQVTSLEKGAVNATIHILTDEGSNLTAVITNESMAEMDISEGKRVVALIKASSVLLAVKQPGTSA
ncbi:transporter [Candidatus Pantoea deserta]|uniref:Transporter n=1 Tax=Candidatus Pantoea deserta TaxID=1869313 RepID=A0A3N4P6Q9_9GAMM|nr:TOBE domain-containing protein [Pantoea deserta]RPE03875.1 transporter [Pantoea deserta]